MWRRPLAFVALGAVVLAGCGSTPKPINPPAYTYAATPSVSAKLICSPEAVADIAHVLGVTTVHRPVPTWVHHRYTCPYVYTDGIMTLSVQELPTLAATSAYMGVLRRQLGDTGPISNVGQGGFTTTNGSAVSRKDNKVLLVEVGQLPAQFGHPATSRSDVALTVTDIIFACWRGD